MSNILIYFLGFIPSIIWLAFYLRKDKHPESNRMVLKIFFFGILSGFVAIFLEKGVQYVIGLIKAGEVWESILVIFIGGALIEEYVKYLVVRLGVFKSSELDEPFDFILYMIISALGFAALENVLIIGSLADKAVETMAWRFISATFLHALCSALLGYFIVLSLYKYRKTMMIIGFTLAAGLHGLYNLSIMRVHGLEKLIIPAIILISLALFISFVIKRVKRLKGVCKIKK